MEELLHLNVINSVPQVVLRGGTSREDDWSWEIGSQITFVKMISLFAFETLNEFK